MVKTSKKIDGRRSDKTVSYSVARGNFDYWAYSWGEMGEWIGAYESFREAVYAGMDSEPKWMEPGESLFITKPEIPRIEFKQPELLKLLRDAFGWDLKILSLRSGATHSMNEWLDKNVVIQWRWSDTNAQEVPISALKYWDEYRKKK